ncbi:hypothetical protein CEUSTIGMA_g13383.t1 [Chlamydomonas eustigma]|uniref:Uncharacterized protein n=1 Tax=Chlamydomonas eustigma TaxID=1157962 RepID=A0A250XSB0_9CHLO|nr:hypothetical protein CEUSTIGMA_g13383.t1 [Chlamydomonas eustigma]|eukprot:GAX85967.1 hypothetical protein CEUSTIGMA_g13383.t1 [Chlamydomonas eustigma]
MPHDCQYCVCSFKFPLPLHRHKSRYPNGTCVRYYATRGGQFHRRTVVANAGISGGNGHDNNTTAHNAEQTEIDIAPAITDDVDQLHLQAEAETGSGDDAETSHEDRVDILNREFFTFLTLSNNGKGINDNDKIRLFNLMSKVAQLAANDKLNTPTPQAAAKRRKKQKHSLFLSLKEKESLRGPQVDSQPTGEEVMASGHIKFYRGTNTATGGVEEYYCLVDNATMIPQQQQQQQQHAHASNSGPPYFMDMTTAAREDQIVGRPYVGLAAASAAASMQCIKDINGDASYQMPPSAPAPAFVQPVPNQNGPISINSADAATSSARSVSRIADINPRHGSNNINQSSIYLIINSSHILYSTFMQHVAPSSRSTAAAAAAAAKNNNASTGT